MGYEHPFHHIPSYNNNDDETKKDDVDKIGAISPPILAAKTKFDITNIMIQLLNLQ